MIEIFADTHKLIASQIHDDVLEKYGLELNKNRLLWWSMAPDILPQYKFIRHYKEESLDYIVSEIIKLIYFSRYLDFNNEPDSLTINILSKKIGLISHYLSDYHCLPHADRWTFTASRDIMVKHIKYESDLEDYGKIHEFNTDIILEEDIEITERDLTTLKEKIEDYINNVNIEYSTNEQGFANDLDYAVSINIKITNFILETVQEYSREIYAQLAMDL